MQRNIILNPGARNVCVKHKEDKDKAESYRSGIFDDDMEAREANPSCTYQIMDGVLKYLKAFQQNYQENIVNYTLCAINNSPAMVPIGSGDNCYLAFAYPETQLTCLKELGPLYPRDAAYEDSINLM